MTLVELNAMEQAAWVAALGGVFEHSPWVAEGVWSRRPFASIDALHAAMVAVVDAAGEARQLALLRAHPELAGKAAVRGELTVESRTEQAGAGLDQCSSDEFGRLQALNSRYNDKFGFPFIVAVKGLDRAGILRELARRLEHDRGIEFAECLRQVARIARFRLEVMFAPG
ncbi:MAG: 2-oxo-4-hydroxy-4-carboxy-5-ureidoimidazoline decarboxylase [Casimicrobiaceae bacterium]